MTAQQTTPTVADDGSSPSPQVPPALAALDGAILGPYTLRLTKVSPRGYVEQVHFELALAEERGSLATPPLFGGVYSSGRPAAGIVGWIDGVYCSPLRFPDGRQIDLAAEGLDRPFFARLGELIPPNGRLMVAYEAFHVDAPLLHRTQEALRRSVPPLATPIGELLFHADCWLGIRDWYIPEGGREGHRKLQGNKALNAAHRQRRAAEAVQELLAFLEQTDAADDALIREARQRSAMIVAALIRYVPDDLRQRAQKWLEGVS